MAKQPLTDEIWELIAASLPKKPTRRAKRGRPQLSDRDALSGVLFVLRTGIAWEDLPRELGYGCGMTCLRRLREWQRSGAWRDIQGILTGHLREARRFDWSRACRECRPSMRGHGTRFQGLRGLETDGDTSHSHCPVVPTEGRDDGGTHKPSGHGHGTGYSAQAF
jgi:transposase